MKIIKHGHACLLLKKAGQKIIIDPGGFTELYGNLMNMKAIIVTHGHADHLNLGNLGLLTGINPGIPLYVPSDAVAQCQDLEARIIGVEADLSVKIASFELDLYHVDHAVVYKSAPCKNLAVKVGDQLYHPGDSLHPIEGKVRYLAVPLVAPWLKAAEAVDFALSIEADLTFPIHDEILQEFGREMMTDLLRTKLNEAGRRFAFIKDGQAVQ